MKSKCKCHPQSPFKWQTDKRPSIIANDRSFKPQTGSLAYLTNGQIQESRERMLAKKTTSLHGLSRSNTEELLRLRTFFTYSAAHAKS